MKNLRRNYQAEFPISPGVGAAVFGNSFVFDAYVAPPGSL